MAAGKGGRPPILRLDPAPMVAVLDKHEVDFIVVGGYAVNAHGVIRSTKDIDICPDPDPANLRRLASALAELGAYQLDAGDLGPKEMPFAPDLEGLSGGGNFTLGTAHGRLDIMQWLDGVDGYAALERHAVERRFAGLDRVRFAGYDELVAMKQAAGRDQDKIDLQDLKAARGEL